MERWNAEALPRDQLGWALSRRDVVAKARQLDSCLLCCGPRVNEAGLCPSCWSMLEGPELASAQRWLQGSGP